MKKKRHLPSYCRASWTWLPGHAYPCCLPVPRPAPWVGHINSIFIYSWFLVGVGSFLPCLYPTYYLPPRLYLPAVPHACVDTHTCRFELLPQTCLAQAFLPDKLPACHLDKAWQNVLIATIPPYHAAACRYPSLTTTILPACLYLVAYPTTTEPDGFACLPHLYINPTDTTHLLIGTQVGWQQRGNTAAQILPSFCPFVATVPATAAAWPYMPRLPACLATCRARNTTGRKGRVPACLPASLVYVCCRTCVALGDQLQKTLRGTKQSKTVILVNTTAEKPVVNGTISMKTPHCARPPHTHGKTNSQKAMKR